MCAVHWCHHLKSTARFVHTDGSTTSTHCRQVRRSAPDQMSDSDPIRQHSQLGVTKQHRPLFRSHLFRLLPKRPGSFFFFFLVNISTSHRGISWCSESFFSKPHSPLCCKHLYKGQVQRLRGVMLVSSPVRRRRRRSNEPSNQCYLYTAQWHTADVVARGVTQSSWSNICF